MEEAFVKTVCNLLVSAVVRWVLQTINDGSDPCDDDDDDDVVVFSSVPLFTVLLCLRLKNRGYTLLQPPIPILKIPRLMQN